MSFVKPVTSMVQDVCVGARLHQFWEALRAGPKVIKMLKESYSPLPDLAKPDKVTDHHKLLCRSSQTFQFKALPFGLYPWNLRKWKRSN